MNNETPINTTTFYYAFISYSHTDEKFVRRLHRKLETYILPKQIRSANPNLPRRLFPIFRDRDELPISSDLNLNILNTLRTSRFLIVVCSPYAAKSLWVDQEIRYFKSVHGSSAILPIIINGEPNAADKSVISSNEECFPDSLKWKIDSDGNSTGEREEPVCGDARKGKDGRSRALLKLLAGLYGIPFSLLSDREKTRKRNRIQWFTVLFLVFFSGLTIIVNGLITSHNIIRRKTAFEYFQRGNEFCNNGKIREAVAFWALSYQTDRTFKVAPRRIASTLTARTFMIPLNDKIMHNGRVGKAVFSMDGTRIISCSNDSTVAVWNAVTGQRLHSFHHNGIVNAVSLSPDEKRVATAAKDSIIRLYDYTSGELLHTFRIDDEVQDVSFSSIKPVLAANTDMDIYTWNIETGLPAAPTLHPVPDLKQYWISDPTFTPDSFSIEFLYMDDFNTNGALKIYKYRPVTGWLKISDTIFGITSMQPLGEIYDYDESEDLEEYGATVFIHYQNELFLIDKNSFIPLAVPYQHTDRMHSLKSTRSGNSFLFLFDEYSDDSGKIGTCTIRYGKPPACLPYSRFEIACPEFVWAIAGMEDYVDFRTSLLYTGLLGTISIWDIRTGGLLTTIRTEGNNESPAINENGTMIAYFFDSNNIEFRKNPFDSVLCRVTVPNSFKSGLAFKENFLFCDTWSGKNGRINLESWAIDSIHLKHTAVSEDNDTEYPHPSFLEISSSPHTNELIVKNTKTKEETTFKNTGIVHCFSPNGRLMAIYFENDSLCIRDVATGEQVTAMYHIKGGGYNSYNRLRFSPNGKKVILSATDTVSSVNIIDLDFLVEPHIPSDFIRFAQSVVGLRLNRQIQFEKLPISYFYDFVTRKKHNYSTNQYEKLMSWFVNSSDNPTVSPYHPRRVADVGMNILQDSTQLNDWRARPMLLRCSQLRNFFTDTDSSFKKNTNSY
ncbi:MAG: TIR domain-containing protein [Chitinispirillaceae bacterium]|nr:TIR domain-containing protein [Chitinispirillaceae bacterium]